MFSEGAETNSTFDMSSENNLRGRALTGSVVGMSCLFYLIISVDLLKLELLISLS